MQLPPLSADLSIVVAGLAAIISAWLRDDGLSIRVNGIIAIVALVIAAGACIFLTSGFSGNLKDDTLLLLAMAVTLATREFFVLLSYIQAAGSPIAPAQVATPSVRPTAQSWPKSSDGE